CARDAGSRPGYFDVW
nr:immunoglobulin heavy chain junction region [Mus musculus]MBK4188017.1 immunoglobulin heavy chain junction region [Mus musculus]